MVGLRLRSLGTQCVWGHCRWQAIGGQQQNVIIGRQGCGIHAGIGAEEVQGKPGRYNQRSLFWVFGAVIPDIFCDVPSRAGSAF